jgi:two-component system, LytTR family, response regulator
MALSCIIIDDEPNALNLIEDYINRTPDLRLMLKTQNAKEGRDAVLKNQPDLVFVDVQMPLMSGLELISKIRHSQTKVIITTAYPEYAIEGFEHDVIDYLLKPITFERFTIAVTKYRIKSSNNPHHHKIDHIFVKVEHRLQRIQLSSVLYIESLRDYVAFHTDKGKILTLDSMKNMESLLPTTQFIRIHKSFMINLEHIDYLERGRIIINRQYLPIGDTYKEKVMKELGF